MTSTGDERGLWEDCNRTELYQRARLHGLAVRPNMSRAELIERLMFKRISLPLYPHPLDSWRIALAQLAIAHRTNLEAQITCPLKSFNPRECFNCPDAQVIYCVTSNPHQHQELLSRKRINTETPFDMSDSSAVLDSIPRNAAAIAAINTFKRRSIAQELGMFATPEERTAFGALAPEAQAANILAALVARDGASGAPPAVATLLPPPTPAPVSAAVAPPPEPTPRPASIPPPAPATPAPAPRPAEPKASGGVGAARILELLEVIQASANEIASDDAIALKNLELQLNENLRVSKENATAITALRGEISALRSEVSLHQRTALTVGGLLLAQAREAFGWSQEEAQQKMQEQLNAFIALATPGEGKAEPSGKAPTKEGKGRK